MANPSMPQPFSAMRRLVLENKRGGSAVGGGEVMATADCCVVGQTGGILIHVHMVSHMAATEPEALWRFVHPHPHVY